MAAKIWGIINSPIVILAIAVALVYFGLFYSTTYYVSRMTGDLSSSSMSYFSYFDGKKYESKISRLDVAKGPSLDLGSQDPPVGPAKAIALARVSLTPSIPALADLKVKSVDLSAVDDDGHYIYIVEFDRGSVPFIGLRIVVLMDGTVIKPSEAAPE